MNLRVEHTLVQKASPERPMPHRRGLFFLRSQKHATGMFLMGSPCGPWQRGAPAVTPSGVPPVSLPTRPLRGLNLCIGHK